MLTLATTSDYCNNRCGKGFGKDVSIALAKKGWAVYAACRTEDAVRDLSSLNIPHLYPVYMDVTKEDHVNRVMATIDREHPEGLFGLVNNAGQSDRYSASRSSSA